MKNEHEHELEEVLVLNINNRLITFTHHLSSITYDHHKIKPQSGRKIIAQGVSPVSMN